MSSESEPATAPLRMKTKVAYGVGAAAEAAAWIAFNTWNFLFYNHVLGLSGTLCGLAVSFSLVVDAFADPIVGFWSDRLSSPYGRRHPFLYAAPIPLALSFCCIFAPPVGFHGFALFGWFTTFSMLFRLALTIYQVPHLALGAELSTDYRERSIVSSYNAIFGVLGGASTFFFGWTWFMFTPGGSSVRTAYPSLGGSVAIVAALVIFLSAWFTRDQIPRLAKPRPGSRASLSEFMHEIRTCLANHNYRVLLFGLLCTSILIGTRQTLGTYTSLFYWGLPEKSIRAFGLVTPPAFVLAFIITVRLHSKFDKRETVIGAMCFLIFAIVFPIAARMFGIFPANGTASLFNLLLLFTALGYGGAAVLQISLLSALADVADEYELTTGRRQEGIFVAAHTLSAKLTSAMGTIFAGVAIDLIHFPQGAKPGQVPADILWKLGLVDGPIASIPAILAVFLYTRYRIDKKALAEIQHGLRERRIRDLGHDQPQPALDAATEGDPTSYVALP